MNSKLEQKLTEMIANHYGVSATEVDQEFIQKKRKELYADSIHQMRFDESDPRSLLETQNQQQIELEQLAATAFLNLFE